MRKDVRLRLFMTADAIGGVLTYALDLASALRPHGIDVTLALVGPPMSEAQRVAALTDGLTLVETGLPLEWLAEDERQVKVAAAEDSRSGDSATAPKSFILTRLLSR